MRYRGYPPKGWKPSPTERVMSRVASKPPAFEDTLPDRLSADERQLWQWLMVEPRRQQDIAAELGLSQQAVAKRERKLRAKVDELYGKPYPWVPRQSPAGGRPRRS
jgi:DNA-binding CsgD family transcriptional regulator